MSLREYFTHMETSPLLENGCKNVGLCSAPIAFEHAEVGVGGALVFEISYEGLSQFSRVLRQTRCTEPFLTQILGELKICIDHQVLLVLHKSIRQSSTYSVTCESDEVCRVAKIEHVANHVSEIYFWIYDTLICYHNVNHIVHSRSK